MKTRLIGAIAAGAAVIASVAAAAGGASTKPFLSTLGHVRTLGSTVPGNGDVNPYGIARVPSSIGREHAGDYLISNFNAKSNNQGTGTTIVQMTPAGKRSLFASISAKSLPGACPGGVGLTTALGVLPHGYVVVGSLPTTNGKSATAQAGCLIVVNATGTPVSTIAGKLIQGPWDLATVSHGATSALFVSMVLNGGADDGAHHVARNSTVVRINLANAAGAAPRVTSETVIANHIPWRDDPSALVIGPTGVALASDGTLYLADTLDNQIRAIPGALTRTAAAAGGGRVVTAGGKLKQPLGLELAPNGDIVTTNAGDGRMVETTPAGRQVATATADTKTGAGSLFGLAITQHAIYYGDDGDNTLKALR